MELCSSWEKGLLDAGSKYTSKQEKVASILESSKKIEKQLPSLDALSLKELNLLIREIKNLLKEADKLRAKVLFEEFFDKNQ